MFYLCIVKFDVTRNLKNFAKFVETKQLVGQNRQNVKTVR